MDDTGQKRCRHAKRILEHKEDILARSIAVSVAAEAGVCG